MAGSLRVPLPAPPPRMLGDDRLQQWRAVVSTRDCSDQLTDLEAATLTVSDQQTLLTVCERFDAFISETWAATSDSTRFTQQPARQPFHQLHDQSTRWCSRESWHACAPMLAGLCGEVLGRRRPSGYVGHISALCAAPAVRISDGVVLRSRASSGPSPGSSGPAFHLAVGRPRPLMQSI